MEPSEHQNEKLLLRAFPLFSPLSDSWLRPGRILTLHLAVMVVLYGTFMIAAVRGDQLWIGNGIGVFENPPFFAHLLATATSVPFLLYLVRRLMRVLQEAPDRAKNEFWNTIERTRLVRVVWTLVAFLGLIALAGSVVMASRFQVDIYDSIYNLPTFIIYSIIRVYQYLICYPSIFAAGLVLPWLSFLALRRASIGYLPFAIDGIGGLKKYLKVFDGPIFAVQTVAVAIALANYVGWGGFKPVSTMIAIAAPVVVTALAAALYLSFAALVRTQRETELQRIVDRQNALYSAMMNADNEAIGKPNDIAEELEASVRVYELVRSTRNFGWVKYLANLSVAVLPNVLTAEVVSQFVTKLMA